METKTINLRDLPDEFVRRAKAHAALSGVTLKDFVIAAVEKAMQEMPEASLKSDSKRRTKK
jgi:predicted DNA-binding protein